MTAAGGVWPPPQQLLAAVAGDAGFASSTSAPPELYVGETSSRMALRHRRGHGEKLSMLAVSVGPDSRVTQQDLRPQPTHLSRGSRVSSVQSRLSAQSGMSVTSLSRAASSCPATNSSGSGASTRRASVDDDFSSLGFECAGSPMARSITSPSSGPITSPLQAGQLPTSVLEGLVPSPPAACVRRGPPRGGSGAMPLATSPLVEVDAMHRRLALSPYGATYARSGVVVPKVRPAGGAGGVGRQGSAARLQRKSTEREKDTPPTVPRRAARVGSHSPWSAGTATDSELVMSPLAPPRRPLEKNKQRGLLHRRRQQQQQQASRAHDSHPCMSPMSTVGVAVSSDGSVSSDASPSPLSSAASSPRNHTPATSALSAREAAQCRAALYAHARPVRASCAGDVADLIAACKVPMFGIDEIQCALAQAVMAGVLANYSAGIGERELLWLVGYLKDVYLARKPAGRDPGLSHAFASVAKGDIVATDSLDNIAAEFGMQTFTQLLGGLGVGGENAGGVTSPLGSPRHVDYESFSECFKEALTHEEMFVHFGGVIADPHAGRRGDAMRQDIGVFGCEHAGLVLDICRLLRGDAVPFEDFIIFICDPIDHLTYTPSSLPRLQKELRTLRNLAAYIDDAGCVVEESLAPLARINAMAAYVLGKHDLTAADGAKKEDVAGSPGQTSRRAVDPAVRRAVLQCAVQRLVEGDGAAPASPARRKTRGRASTNGAGGGGGLLGSPAASPRARRSRQPSRFDQVGEGLGTPGDSSLLPRERKLSSMVRGAGGSSLNVPSDRRLSIPMRAANNSGGLASSMRANNSGSLASSMRAANNSGSLASSMRAANNSGSLASMRGANNSGNLAVSLQVEAPGTQKRRARRTTFVSSKGSVDTMNASHLDLLAASIADDDADSDDRPMLSPRRARWASRGKPSLIIDAGTPTHTPADPRGTDPASPLALALLAAAGRNNAAHPADPRGLSTLTRCLSAAACVALRTLCGTLPASPPPPGAKPDFASSPRARDACSDITDGTNPSLSLSDPDAAADTHSAAACDGLSAVGMDGAAGSAWWGGQGAPPPSALAAGAGDEVLSSGAAAPAPHADGEGAVGSASERTPARDAEPSASGSLHQWTGSMSWTVGQATRRCVSDGSGTAAPPRDSSGRVSSVSPMSSQGALGNSAHSQVDVAPEEPAADPRARDVAREYSRNSSSGSSSVTNAVGFPMHVLNRMSHGVRAQLETILSRTSSAREPCSLDSLLRPRVPAGGPPRRKQRATTVTHRHRAPTVTSPPRSHAAAPAATASPRAQRTRAYTHTARYGV